MSQFAQRNELYEAHLVYIAGTFALIWYAVWEYVAYDSPAKHPTISKAERFYIESSIGGNAFDPLVL